MSARHKERPVEPRPRDADADAVTTTFTRSLPAVKIVGIDWHTGTPVVQGTGSLLATSVATVQVEGDSPTPAASPESSLGDLVVYWSATQDFREDGVRGPFRLVACTDCVLNDSTGAVVEGVRFWIGTAGAAVVTEASGVDFLYVYYVVENSTAFLSAIDDRDKLIRMADGMRVDRYEDGVDAALLEVAASIAETNDVIAGTWLRKIALADLAAVIADEASYNVEEAWDDLPNATIIVPGTVVGRVRIWDVADYGTEEGDIQEKFTATAADGTIYSVFWADPAPVFDGVTLALFVAGIMPAAVGTSEFDAGLTDLNPYLAVWSCVAITEDKAGDAFGLYFTVRVPSTVRPDGGSDHDDRIAGGGSSTRLFLDPDPVGEIDGVGWCVYVGVDEGGGSTGALTLYVATDSEQIFRPWNSP